MLQLAQKFALLKGTKIIAHAFKDNVIVFVVESGQKYTMDTRQLEQAIAELKEAEAPTALDLTDGVDEAEAAAAGKALQKRRKTKSE